MTAQHASRSTMERFLRAELPRRQTREVVRHLLARCPSCAEAAATAAGQLGSPPESYDEAFANVRKRLEQMEERRLFEQRDVAELWSVLEDQPQARRLMMIGNDRRFESLSLHGRLLARAREIERLDPPKAAELAELALAVAERLDAARHGAESVSEARAAARAALEEAHRLEADLVCDGRPTPFRPTSVETQRPCR